MCFDFVSTMYSLADPMPCLIIEELRSSVNQRPSPCMLQCHLSAQIAVLFSLTLVPFPQIRELIMLFKQIYHTVKVTSEGTVL